MAKTKYKAEPKIELTRKQQFIQTLMHAFIIVTLLGIFFKVLLL